MDNIKLCIEAIKGNTESSKQKGFKNKKIQAVAFALGWFSNTKEKAVPCEVLEFIMGCDDLDH